MSTPNARQIAADIIAYLQKNPEGKDTAEGIARFWLSHNHHDVSLEEVERALDALVEKGKLSVVGRGEKSALVFKLKR